MLNGFNHVALIVSGEKTLEFYKKIGFKETGRTFRQDKNDYRIMLEDGRSCLEVFMREDAPERHCAPEAYGCRHIAFNVPDLDALLEALDGYERQEIRVSPTGKRFVFVTDPDRQPVEFLEE